MRSGKRQSKNIEDRRFMDFQEGNLFTSRKKMLDKTPTSKKFDANTEARNLRAADNRASTTSNDSSLARRRIVDTTNDKASTRGKQKSPDGKAYSKLDTQVTPGKWKQLNTVSYGN